MDQPLKHFAVWKEQGGEREKVLYECISMEPKKLRIQSMVMKIRTVIASRTW